MESALTEYLRDHPEGVAAIDVGRNVMRLSGPPRLITRLAAKSLEAVPDATRGADGLWRLDAAPDLPVVAAYLLATGPVPEIDEVLAIGLVRDRERLLSLSARPGRPIHPKLLADARRRVSDLIAGSRLLLFDTGRFVKHLGTSPKELTLLKPALRAAGRIGARDDLYRAADKLELPIPTSDEPTDIAMTVMRIYKVSMLLGIDPANPPAPTPAFDFDRVGFEAELLEEIPPRPGVYRFFDRDGELLYVGKAKNLKTRVASYFGRRAKRRKRFPELLERLHTVTWEEKGSELAALLAEQEGIRTEQPAVNVQREVHRRRPTEGDFVLFLPGETDGEVVLHFVSEGQPVGRVVSNVRARGMRTVRAALQAAFRAPEPPEVSEEDARIVTTWLRRELSRANWLDLTEVQGQAEAARLVRAYLTDPELFTGRVWHR